MDCQIEAELRQPINQLQLQLRVCCLERISAPAGRLQQQQQQQQHELSQMGQSKDSPVANSNCCCSWQLNRVAAASLSIAGWTALVQNHCSVSALHVIRCTATVLAGSSWKWTPAVEIELHARYAEPALLLLLLLLLLPMLLLQRPPGTHFCRYSFSMVVFVTINTRLPGMCSLKRAPSSSKCCPM
jgi:hypothetical protein